MVKALSFFKKMLKCQLFEKIFHYHYDRVNNMTKKEVQIFELILTTCKNSSSETGWEKLQSNLLVKLSFGKISLSFDELLEFWSLR